MSPFDAVDCAGCFSSADCIYTVLLQPDEETVEKLIVQAKEAFGTDNVIAADDLMTISISRR